MRALTRSKFRRPLHFLSIGGPRATGFDSIAHHAGEPGSDIPKSLTTNRSRLERYVIQAIELTIVQGWSTRSFLLFERSPGVLSLAQVAGLVDWACRFELTWWTIQWLARNLRGSHNRFATITAGGVSRFVQPTNRSKYASTASCSRLRRGFKLLSTISSAQKGGNLNERHIE